MEKTQIPGAAELAQRASRLAPLLRSHAAWGEQNRRVHDESIEALTDAGIFRMRMPQGYGGFESDAATMVAVASELARHDASAAWTASVSWITTWMVGLFPDEVQDEVFATPDLRTCGTLSPSALAEPVDGGFRFTGRWGFVSGALHSQWQVLVAMTPTPDGRQMPVLALARVADLRIVDDWDTEGLRGSGSVSTVAENIFVPAAWVLPLPAVLQEQYASRRNADARIFRGPLLPTASASSVGVAIGLARAAIEAFQQRLPNRKITYTTYDDQRDAPITHLQLADATLTADAAQFHAERVAALLDTKNADAAQWTLLERTRARADMGRACELAQHAVGVLRRASGGSSIYRTVPIQQIFRDVQAINLHALMHPDTNLELYGRVLCGLEPNTFYL
ncbi:acyl-CoA dehydrogenase family protein [Micromonospora sp. NPDC048999]|uniref:acyl-CoA dehydrogenase family protein n=1 Tax=Micromonospora sp. NPDC048999 TaxID=3155391 RepID=UPI0033E33E9F